MKKTLLWLNGCIAQFHEIDTDKLPDNDGGGVSQLVKLRCWSCGQATVTIDLH